MNCDTVRHRLMTQECPEAPPADVAAHLTACPACRAFLGQLLRVEREVPALPAGSRHVVGNRIHPVEVVQQPPVQPVRAEGGLNGREINRGGTRHERHRAGSGHSRPV